MCIATSEKARRGSRVAARRQHRHLPRPHLVPEDGSVTTIESMWQRICVCAGQQFHTVSGLPFTYEVTGSYLRVDRANRSLSRTNFARALPLLPADGPGQPRDRQGASYMWAILMDPRIRQEEW